MQDCGTVIKVRVPVQRGQHSPGGWYWRRSVHWRTGQAFFEQVRPREPHLHLRQGSSEVTSLSSVAIWPLILHSVEENCQNVSF